jgi:cobalamin biosynthetic protein CobC
VRHGGDLDRARRSFPAAPEPWIDLSTGINPIPYPLPSLLPEVWTRLPLDSEEEDLRAAAAVRYGATDPALVVAAPGSQALIQVLPRLKARARVAIVGPTYGEHHATWRREGHDVREVRDLAAAAAADVAIVVNPNNPTGRLLAARDLVELANTLSGRGGLLVVDEAFMDFMPLSASLVPRLPAAAVVLRSFGKAYGLPGLRLGFAIAGRPTAQRLRDLLGPWAISGPALAIGRQALADEAWLRASSQRLACDAERLDTLLAQAGATALGGTPLFRLVAHREADRIADTLGRHGIHVRRFPEHPAWLRFGVPGSEAAWQRLAAALQP